MAGRRKRGTERKQAEEALRASEASYRSLFDNMLNCLCNVRFDLRRRAGSGLWSTQPWENYDSPACRT